MGQQPSESQRGPRLAMNTVLELAEALMSQEAAVQAGAGRTAHPQLLPHHILTTTAAHFSGALGRTAGRGPHRTSRSPPRQQLVLRSPASLMSAPQAVLPECDGWSLPS